VGGWEEVKPSKRGNRMPVYVWVYAYEGPGARVGCSRPRRNGVLQASLNK
jgi:hypothetical protein